MNPSKNIQFLAYYLPQFHPIPENDKWWGKGFTEWTNVAKAKPLFKGHYQPILPADLGFYDLRVPEVQEAQSEMALSYGIDGFIYYQYWFGNGKMLLEKPAEAMLKNKAIKIPFCFCWANETWKGIWHGLDNPDVLIEQVYEGEKGYIAYFEYLLPFFNDERYIKVDNKPMFHVYKLDDIPDLDLFIRIFNRLALENGFEGIYLIATHGNPAIVAANKAVHGQVGVDVFHQMRYKSPFKFGHVRYLGKIERRVNTFLGITNVVGKRQKPLIFDYNIAVSKLNPKIINPKYIPCVFPNWDNSARSGKKSLIFTNATPELWAIYLRKVILNLKSNPKNPEFIVIKSWNEWAEGNHLEPDRKFGYGWLEGIKNVKAALNN